MLSLELADVSATQYAKVMNNAAITDDGDNKVFSLYRGDTVNALAIMASLKDDAPHPTAPIA